jgi:AraC-like DNA-binding protein/quercetin dioxygenase-like cupin family protein
MAQAPPLYREHRQTYVADTCGALVDAIRRGRVRLETLVCGHYPGRKLPPGVLPGVKSLGFWQAEGAQDWGLDWHRNEGIELTFLERGQLPFSVDGRDFQLKPGDLTITRPWQLHRVGNPHIAASRLHCLILDIGVRRPHQAWTWPSWLVLSKPDLRQLTKMLRQNEQPVWRAPDELRRLFPRIAAAVESDTGGENASRLTLQLNELFLLVLEMCRTSNVPLDASLSISPRTVELFLADLAGSPQQLGQPWTLTRMAEQCGLGVTRFVHHSKQLTNMTPLEYLNRCRLEEAGRQLTAEPARTVTDIALACGFSSPQYFATVFGRHFGCTPREFRERTGKMGG